MPFVTLFVVVAVILAFLVGNCAGRSDAFSAGHSEGYDCGYSTALAQCDDAWKEELVSRGFALRDGDGVILYSLVADGPGPNEEQSSALA